MVGRVYHHDRVILFGHLDSGIAGDEVYPMIGSIGGRGNGFIDVSVTGLDKVMKRLEKLGPEAGAAGTVAATNYLLNVIENKEIPESKSVFRGSRTMAYGVPFFTEKQRRFFFWAVRNGVIDLPYKRRGKAGGMQSEWKVTGKGLSYRIYNTSRAAFFIYDDQHQARQLGLAGWNKIGQIVIDYLPKIVQAFVRGVNSYIKKSGMK